MCFFFNWARRHEDMSGEWRNSSTHSLTSALHGGEWSASRPGRFICRERAPDTHCIGDCVGPRAILDAVVKRKIPSSLHFHRKLCNRRHWPWFWPTLCRFVCYCLQWTWPKETSNIPCSKFRIHFLLPKSLQRLNPSPRPCVTFRNKIFFYGEYYLAPRQTPKLKYHPLSPIRDCLYQYIRSYPPYLYAVSSIRNSRTRPAMVPGTHVTWKYHYVI
jgi:hypothetical protein